MGKGRAPASRVLDDWAVFHDERGVAQACRTRALFVLGGPERIHRKGGTYFDVIGESVGSIDGGRYLVEMNRSIFAVGCEAESIPKTAFSDLRENEFSD